MEKSLQQLTAESLVENYPLDVLEYLVDAGQKKINHETKMKQVIWFKMDKLLEKLEDESSESYLFVAQFCLDMQINQHIIIYDDINRGLNELIERTNGLDPDWVEIGGVLDRYLGLYQSFFDRSPPRNVITLLNQYPQYIPYYKIIDCHKYDYIYLYQHKFSHKYGYEIETDLSEIKLNPDLISLAVYQVR